MKTNRYVIIVSITALLLIIPFIGMQFTDEISWSWLDFEVAATLFLLSGFALDCIFKNSKCKKQKILLSLGALFILLIVWIGLAVGIFKILFWLILVSNSFPNKRYCSLIKRSKIIHLKFNSRKKLVKTSLPTKL